jgi:hypothetical protein
LRARIDGAVIRFPGTGEGVARLVFVSIVKVDMRAHLDVRRGNSQSRLEHRSATMRNRLDARALHALTINVEDERMRTLLILASTALVLGTGTALSAQSQPSGTPPAEGQPAAQDPQATPANEAPATDPAASAPSEPAASATTTDGKTDQKSDKKKRKKAQAEDQPQPQ